MISVLTLNPPFIGKIKLTFTLKRFFIISLLFVLPLLFFYIVQANSLTQYHYLLQGAKNKTASLALENELLEIEFSKASSLANLDGHLSSAGFVRSGKVKYIKILEGQMVRR